MKRSGRWILGVVIVALLATVVWRAVSNQQQKKQAIAAATQTKELPIQLSAQEVVAIAPRSLELTIPVSGVVQAVNSAVVKAYVAGELRGLTVREGDNVKKGQVLAKIDATEFEARWRQAQRQADASKAQLAIAQRQQDNNVALVQKGFISTTALATSQANLDSAKANLESAQAAADVARKSVADTVITSPMDGQISQRFVQNGERVGIETRIVEVVDRSQLEVVAQLAPSDSIQAQVGQKAHLQVPGTAQDMPQVQATVVRINPSAQTGSRTVAVYLSVVQDSKIDSTQRTIQLRPGLFLQGNIVTGNTEQLAVPLTSVLTDKPQPYVQVLQKSAAAQSTQAETTHSAPIWRVSHRPVQLGSQSAFQGATWVQVTQGLKAGEQVLAGSAGALREGTAVQIKAADAPVAAQAPSSAEAR